MSRSLMAKRKATKPRKTMLVERTTWIRALALLEASII
jgi:hypothetical protein